MSLYHLHCRNQCYFDANHPTFFPDADVNIKTILVSYMKSTTATATTIMMNYNNVNDGRKKRRIIPKQSGTLDFLYVHVQRKVCACVRNAQQSYYNTLYIISDNVRNENPDIYTSYI